MAWQRQNEKLLKQKVKFSRNDIVTTGADGKTYEMVSIPTRNFADCEEVQQHNEIGAAQFCAVFYQRLTRKQSLTF
ncbi:MAG: hypothetical protein F9K43_07945 [Bauldia sp.]|nr:MAG: hypothetical protein F9K43_07945 [Bauldia sp.]PWB84005.1 MAG: hypothetical protein C3F11_03700 [Methylocystaceae bacterium]